MPDSNNNLQFNDNTNTLIIVNLRGRDDIESVCRTVDEKSDMTMTYTSSKALFDLMTRYRLADGIKSKKILAEQALISYPDLLRACIWRIGSVNEDDKEILGYFASAYFHKGHPQRQELFDSLKSQDRHFVIGLLELLCHTTDLDTAGKPSNQPLGRSEMTPKIASVLINHPDLKFTVARTLAYYGEHASNEADTLLTLMLDGDERLSFVARLTLRQVDDSLYKKFKLDCEKPLTEDQTVEIKKYLSTRKVLYIDQEAEKRDLSVSTFYNDIIKYTRAQTASERSEIAKCVAIRQPYLWQSCCWRLGYATDLEEQALGHFAYCYFDTEPEKRAELLELLRCGDANLVENFLRLMQLAGHFKYIGTGHPTIPLGGKDLIPEIVQLLKVHPSLDLSVATTLGNFGPLAEPHICVLLKMMLNQEGISQSIVRKAILKIDTHEISKEFGINELEPLPFEQYEKVRKYLMLRCGD